LLGPTTFISLPGRCIRTTRSCHTSLSQPHARTHTRSSSLRASKAACGSAPNIFIF
jgi:hypothetical protein